MSKVKLRKLMANASSSIEFCFRKRNQEIRSFEHKISSGVARTELAYYPHRLSGISPSHAVIYARRIRAKSGSAR